MNRRGLFTKLFGCAAAWPLLHFQKNEQSEGVVTADVASAEGAVVTEYTYDELGRLIKVVYRHADTDLRRWYPT